MAVLVPRRLRPAGLPGHSGAALIALACVLLLFKAWHVLVPQAGGGLPLPRWEHVEGNVSLAMQVPGWARCPAAPCKYTEMSEGEPDSTVPWNSQFGEDAWLIHNLLWHKRNGFFLEMGAMNGVDLSNTLWLHRAAGWRGLLIEACPEQYTALAQLRRDSIAVHAAVCATFQTVHWLSAGNVGGIWEFMAQGFKDTFHKDADVAAMPSVPCVPMPFILDSFGIAEIDFWSLDVEGAELEVLKTVDFSRLKVRVLMVELDGHNPEKDAAVTQLLRDAGFDVVPKRTDEEDPGGRDLRHYNTVFVHKDAWKDVAHAPNVTTVQM